MRLRNPFTIVCTILVFFLAIFSHSNASASEASTSSNDKQYSKPYPINAEELLTQGVSDAEKFRRSLLQPSETGVLPAELIAKGILEFQKQAKPHLEKRPGLQRFKLSVDNIVKAVRGYPDPLDPDYSFKPFQGQWFGEWDGMKVDHEWRDVQTMKPPQRMGNPSVNVHHLQYAWIGDGFGWNIIASQKQNNLARHFILGTVYHIENNDLDQIYLTRPHVGVVGIEQNQNKIIWITKGEIFLEEAFPTQKKVGESYAITGFRYKRDASMLQNKRNAFQAIYTRQPDKRPEFYKFNIDIKVKMQ